MSEQWLSIVEYARTYQVSDMTVRRRIKTGKLHAILQDGKYFIPTPGPDGRVAVPQATINAVEGREAAPKVQAQTYPRHAAQHLGYSQPSHRLQAPDLNPPKAYTTPTANLQPTKSVPARAASMEDSEGQIPSSLRRAVSADEISLVDSRALLAFCEASLRKIAEGERRTVEKFKSKLEALEALLAQRDLEVKALRQQTEDLQLLVKILEKRK